MIMGFKCQTYKLTKLVSVKRQKNVKTYKLTKKQTINVPALDSLVPKLKRKTMSIILPCIYLMCHQI